MIYRKDSDQPALLEKLAFVNLAAIVFVAQIGEFSCEPGRIFSGASFQDGAVSSPKTIFQPEIFVLFQVFLKWQIAPFQKRGGDAENNYFLVSFRRVHSCHYGINDLNHEEIFWASAEGFLKTARGSFSRSAARSAVPTATDHRGSPSFDPASRPRHFPVWTGFFNFASATPSGLPSRPPPPPRKLPPGKSPERPAFFRWDSTSSKMSSNLASMMLASFFCAAEVRPGASPEIFIFSASLIRIW